MADIPWARTAAPLSESEWERINRAVNLPDQARSEIEGVLALFRYFNQSFAEQPRAGVTRKKLRAIALRADDLLKQIILVRHSGAERSEAPGIHNPSLSSKRFVKIDPLRVCRFDQIDLPLPPPLLEFLFAGNGGQGIIVTFEPNQQVNVVASGKPGDDASLVLVRAGKKIAGDPDVQGTVLAASQYIHVVHNTVDLWLWIPGSGLRPAPE